MPLDNLGQFYEVRHHEPWTSISAHKYRCYLLQFADGEKIWSNGKDITIHWPASGSHLAVHTLAITHVAHIESVDITTSFVYSEDEQHGLYKTKMDISVGMSLVVKIDHHNELAVVEWDLNTPVESRETSPEGSPTKETQTGLRVVHVGGGDGATEESTQTGSQTPLAPPTPLEQPSKKAEKVDESQDENVPNLTRYAPEKKAGATKVDDEVEDIGPSTQAGCRIPALPLKIFFEKTDGIKKDKTGHEQAETNTPTSEYRTPRSAAESTTEYHDAEASVPAASVGAGIAPIPLEVLKATPDIKSPEIGKTEHFGLDGCTVEDLKNKGQASAHHGPVGMEQGIKRNTVSVGDPALPMPLRSPVLQHAPPSTDVRSEFDFGVSNIPTKAKLDQLEVLANGGVGSKIARRGSVDSMRYLCDVSEADAFRSHTADLLDALLSKLDTRTLPSSAEYSDEELERQNDLEEDIFNLMKARAPPCSKVVTPRNDKDVQKSLAEQWTARFESLSLYPASSGASTPQSAIEQRSTEQTESQLDKTDPSSSRAFTPRVTTEQCPAELRAASLEYRFPYQPSPPISASVEPTLSSYSDDDLDSYDEEQSRLRDEEYYDSLLEHQLDYSWYDIDDHYLPASVRNNWPPLKVPLPEAPKPVEQVEKEEEHQSLRRSHYKVEDGSIPAAVRNNTPPRKLQEKKSVILSYLEDLRKDKEGEELETGGLFERLG
ncbi:hypothetical protein BJ508DRAFT_361940 [Ascobolus immersus RN42]|uniref:Uncharacterized protein n=1 Tax=Ascobolus immersus RN42 TaxID=1160509 RepID=A0A3N4I7A8_ASCIM|nr:hypothetical protein BJ508DRAFT_361940 [Ascobolus immersus RN42]